MKAALYLRVSTDQQTVANQKRELEAVAERHGWTILGVYADEGVSGARSSRPALDKLMLAVARREVDVVAAWSVDRLGRSLPHLLHLLGEFQAKNVDLYLHQQGLDTRSPSGRAMFQMCGVFAEFERAILRERIRSGIARAKAQGRVLGRPRRALDLDLIRAQVAAGQSLKAIAAALKVPKSTLSGRLRQDSRTHGFGVP
jgi:DNA invertase Pin-like site-specific DNA recombinase